VHPVVILGCGYTGSRVARRLRASGVPVVATARDASALGALAREGVEVLAVDATIPATVDALGARAARLPAGFAALCSVPPVAPGGQLADATATLLAALGRPRRVVHLSTTSVYGEQVDVDERTAVSPRSAADHVRVEGEVAARSGAWSSLVLRPAAIYGPGRGIHATAAAVMRRALDPDRLVSRIHVDDLAALCVAALERDDVTGAFPVADDEPATPRELARFCATLGVAVELPPPGSGGAGGRRVDGRAARAALGVALRYPTYRDGIPASLVP
jgi:nucleoside-diphosphate-sugar epimerase